MLNFSLLGLQFLQCAPIQLIFLCLVSPFFRFSVSLNPLSEPNLLLCLRRIRIIIDSLVVMVSRDSVFLVWTSGLFFILPCTDYYTKVDLRTVSFDVPPQEVSAWLSVTTD